MLDANSHDYCFWHPPAGPTLIKSWATALVLHEALPAFPVFPAVAGRPEQKTPTSQRRKEQQQESKWSHNPNGVTYMTGQPLKVLGGSVGEPSSIQGCRGQCLLCAGGAGGPRAIPWLSMEVSAQRLLHTPQQREAPSRHSPAPSAQPSDKVGKEGRAGG